MKLFWITAGLAAVALVLLASHRTGRKSPVMAPPVDRAPEAAPAQEVQTSPAPSLPPEIKPATNINPGLLELGKKFSLRKRDFTPAEREELAKKFATSLKPAVEKFCHDYAEHIPFNPDELSMSNFVERIGHSDRFSSYIFVLNGITIGVEDSNQGQRTVLNYIASGPQMHQLNQVPTTGNAPTLDMPVTREQIIAMVQTDTGTEFQPSDVVMRPTGAASSLNGGVFVEIGHMFTQDNPAPLLSFVFGPDGKIVTYTRAPTF
jgi:hypothetical protein